MHEVYLAEEIINIIKNKAETKNAQEVLEVRVAVPEDDHYTPEAFADILKMQAEGTVAERAQFYVLSEKIDKPYIKDIKVR